MEPTAISRELRAAAGGDRSAHRRLLPLVYDELSAIARDRMKGERKNHTLQSSDLVHEAYLRLMQDTEADWKCRAHFFGAAAEAMRRILIEHARARGRLKRGGDAQGRPPLRLPLSGIADLAAERDGNEVVALDEAIQRLEARDARAGQVVLLRFYAGLSIQETAAALGVVERTVKRDWEFARAWLYRELAGGSE
jgi:RNA polymerase sigma factor (TIGR02999 family)